VDQARARGGAGAGEEPGPLAVDAKGPLLVGLGVVDGGVRRAVHHHVGVVFRERPVHRRGVGDVQGGAVETDELLTAAGEFLQHVVAEHPAGTGDQPLHQPRSTRALSGSHQARLSRYQATVSARPLAKSCCGW
jgi:hypothetical protein